MPLHPGTRGKKRQHAPRGCLSCLHKRRFPAQGVGFGGGGEQGWKISQEKARSLGDAPEDRGLARRCPGRGGWAPRARGLAEGAGSVPDPWTAELRPHCLNAVTSGASPPPPKHPQHRSPPPAALDPDADRTTTAPSRPRWTGQAASPAAAAAAQGSAIPGEDGSWAAAAPAPRGQRAQGREWAVRPARTKRPRRGAGAEGTHRTAGGRGLARPGAGTVAGRGARWRRRRAAGAASTEGPGSPTARGEDGAAGRDRRCGRGVREPVGRGRAASGARRPGAWLAAATASSLPSPAPPCSPASSSSSSLESPPRHRRRRLSLGASRASSLHQGRAAPQGAIPGK